MKKLTDSQAAAGLRELPQWTLEPEAGAITREFLLLDFAQAFAFMTQIALAAETRNHHPEWSNVYRKVRMTWTTHDAGGLTEKDIEMALLCDRVFASYAVNTPGN